jgi:(4S)-4-hydroxy-5-phosphonooxypentane-2,3-dione isomerase
MKVVIVHIHVLPGKSEKFIAATLANQAQSRKEAGILRFDLLADEADPCRFVLIEGYRDSAAQAAHKETAHYAAWRDAVEPLMAESRSRAVYAELGPGA